MAPDISMFVESGNSLTDVTDPQLLTERHAIAYHSMESGIQHLHEMTKASITSQKPSGKGQGFPGENPVETNIENSFSDLETNLASGNEFTEATPCDSDGAGNTTHNPKRKRETSPSPKKWATLKKRRGLNLVPNDDLDSSDPEEDENDTDGNDRPGPDIVPPGMSKVRNYIPQDPLRVYSFGTGNHGELGHGYPCRTQKVPRLMRFCDEENSPVSIVQVACGPKHALALTNLGTVFSWGNNKNFELGRTTSSNGDSSTLEPSEDNGVEAKCWIPAKVNDALIHPRVKFSKVAAGGSYSLALTQTGQIYAWGTFINEGEQMFYVYKDFRRTNQDKPMLLREFEGIIDIACGEKHAVAIDNRCQIWTWGWGTDHRLGRSLACVADLVDTFTPTIVRSACLARSVAAGYGHTLVLDLEGHLWAWGDSQRGQAGHSENGDGFVHRPQPVIFQDIRDLTPALTQVSGGRHHSALVSVQGVHFAMGFRRNGRLGVPLASNWLVFADLFMPGLTSPPFQNISRPIQVLQANDAPHYHATAVGCGADHTIFLGHEKICKSSGLGASYQLGSGSVEDRDTPQDVILEDGELGPRDGQDAKGESAFCWAGAGETYSMIAARENPTRISPPEKPQPTAASTGETADMFWSSAPSSSNYSQDPSPTANLHQLEFIHRTRLRDSSLCSLFSCFGLWRRDQRLED